MAAIDTIPNPLLGVPIPVLVKNCSIHFNVLLTVLPTSSEYSMFSRAFGDASGRFKIWSGNIGAHHTGRRSLDHRLRDASHLQEHVLKLLSSLIQSLSDAIEISRGTRIPWDQLQFSDSESDESEDNEDTSTELEEFRELQHKTEMDQIVAGVNEAITNLLRLSATIRNPARHDQWLNFSENLDTTHYEQFDIAHVATKFPQLSVHLARRLGIALSRRRCYFKYREEHRNKMASDLITLEQDGKSTIASSLPENLKTLTVSSSTPDDDENQSDGGFTATSFATSIADPSTGRIPPLPPGKSYDEYFECPFCYDMIMVSNRPAWKKHVYSDLQPYVCLWEDCSIGGRMFPNRHTWLQHEQHYHGKAWACCLGCSRTFSDHQEMRAHYLGQHTAQTQGKIDEILEASETRKSNTRSFPCPLCLTTVSSVKAYARHTGRHLRELSLFCLPVYATDENTENDSSGNESHTEENLSVGHSENESDAESDVFFDDSANSLELNSTESPHDGPDGLVKHLTEDTNAAIESERTESINTSSASINFQDAVGRKFRFPLHICKTWKGMEELIKQAFLKVDVLGPHVQEGHYDLIVDGEIILPQVWETMVQPDWLVKMHMWPIPERVSQGPQGPVDSISESVLPTHLRDVNHQDQQSERARPEAILPVEKYTGPPRTPTKLGRRKKNTRLEAILPVENYTGPPRTPKSLGRTKEHARPEVILPVEDDTGPPRTPTRLGRKTERKAPAKLRRPVSNDNMAN